MENISSILMEYVSTVSTSHSNCIAQSLNTVMPHLHPLMLPYSQRGEVIVGTINFKFIAIATDYYPRGMNFKTLDFNVAQEGLYFSLWTD